MIKLKVIAIKCSTIIFCFLIFTKDLYKMIIWPFYEDYFHLIFFTFISLKVHNLFTAFSQYIT